MRRILPALAAALLWPAAALAQEPPVDPACPQGDLQTPRPPGSVCIGRMTPGYHFAFIYSPDIAAEFPGLARMLHARARRSEAWIAGEARRWLRERAEAGGEAFPLSYEEGWRLDAAPPGLIAASATIQHYTGGAHGGIEYRALILDRRSGRQVRLAGIFTDLRPVQAAFCAELTRAVRDRLNNDSRPPCPDLATLPVTFRDGEDGRIQALNVLIAPYIVGSWAEGPYEIDVVTASALRAFVRPAYRRDF